MTTQRVSQGGGSVAYDGDPQLRVSQGGGSVAYDGATRLQVSQAGASVAYRLPQRVSQAGVSVAYYDQEHVTPLQTLGVTEYTFVFRKATGVKFGIVGQSYGGSTPARGPLRNVEFGMGCNRMGYLHFALDTSHTLATVLREEYGAQVEVWRKLPGQAPRLEFIGIYDGDLNGDLLVGGTGALTFNLQGPLVILTRAAVGWYAGYSDRTKFTAQAAETVVRGLVRWNATSDATTANGRQTTFLGAYPFTIQYGTDTATGTVRDWNLHGMNLLEALQTVAETGAGDFDLLRLDQIVTGGSVLTWRLAWYAGQRGTDRSTGSAKIVFSVGNGNVAEFHLTQRRSDRATVALSAGQGTGSARAVSVVAADDYSAENHRELFVNASNSDTANGRISQGRAALAEQRVERDYTFEIQQTKAYRFGQHYFLGDLVTVVDPLDNSESVHKIDYAVINLPNDGPEKVRILTERQV